MLLIHLQMIRPKVAIVLGKGSRILYIHMLKLSSCCITKKVVSHHTVMETCFGKKVIS